MLASVSSIEKFVGDVGQTDVVDIDQVEHMVYHAAALGPFVFPPGAGNDARVFGAFLVGERRAEFGVGANLLAETFVEEREDEFREVDVDFAGIFRIFVVDKSGNVAGDAFVVNAEFSCKSFGAASDVAMLVGCGDAESEVAL